MKKFLNKYKGEIFTFILTSLILFVLFKILGVFDHTILKIDMESQTYPLTQYFLSFLKGDVGLYTFNFGMGDSFLGTLFYYLMSPFNLLVLLFKDIESLLILNIFLKLSLSSVFCYKFLNYHFKDNKMLYMIIFSLFYGLSSYVLSYNMFPQFLDCYMIFPLVLLGIDKMIGENKYSLYIFGLLYTIFTNYYFSYMVCIFCFLYFNYRLLHKISDKKEIIIKNIKFIFISFLICFSMGFIYFSVVEEIGSYSRVNSALFGGEQLKILFDFNDFVYHYLLGYYRYVPLSFMYAIYIYTSIIALPLIYLYFINNKFKFREKVLTGIMFLILLLSIGVNYFNYAWHGFVPPCGLNGRYTFMFILFIVYICFKSIINIKEFKIIHYIIPFSFIYIFVFLYSFINYPRLLDINIVGIFILIYFSVIIASLFIKKHNNIKSYIGVFLFFIIISLILYLFRIIDFSYFIRLLILPICSFLLCFVFRNKNIKFKHYFYFFLGIFLPFSLYTIVLNRYILGEFVAFKVIILLLLVILLKFIPKNKFLKYIFVLLLFVELTYNGFEYLYRYVYKTDFDNSYQEVIDYIKEYDNSKFYRIEDNFEDTFMNSSIMYNYNGVDYFMSTIKKDFVQFFDDVGAFDYTTGENTVFYDGSYHLLSSLINIRYFVDEAGLGHDEYKLINNIDEFDIYKNEDSLELGYLVDKDILKVKKDKGFGYINNIYKSMSSNDKDVLNNINVDRVDKYTFKFNNTSDKDIYLLFDFNNNYVYYDAYNVSVNGEVYKGFTNSSLFKIKNTFELNEEIEIKIKFNIKPKDYSDLIRDDLRSVLDGNFELYASYYDKDVYKKDIDILNDNQMEVTKVVKDKLVGNVNLTKDGILFISLLYNDDLDVYVDGKKHDKLKLLDTFIGIELDEGEHEVKLVYNNNRIYLYLIISIISFISLIIVCFKYKKKKSF